jgi:hypothetical protein
MAKPKMLDSREPQHLQFDKQTLQIVLTAAAQVALQLDVDYETFLSMCENCAAPLRPAHVA